MEGRHTFPSRTCLLLLLLEEEEEETGRHMATAISGLGSEKTSFWRTPASSLQARLFLSPCTAFASSLQPILHLFCHLLIFCSPHLSSSSALPLSHTCPLLPPAVTLPLLPLCCLIFAACNMYLAASFGLTHLLFLYLCLPSLFSCLSCCLPLSFLTIITLPVPATIFCILLCLCCLPLLCLPLWEEGLGGRRKDREKVEGDISLCLTSSHLFFPPCPTAPYTTLTHPPPSYSMPLPLLPHTFTALHILTHLSAFLLSLWKKTGAEEGQEDRTTDFHSSSLHLT